MDLLAGDLPAGAHDIDEWMVRGPLSATRPLLYEARHLVDDPQIRDYAPAPAAVPALTAVTWT